MHFPTAMAGHTTGLPSLKIPALLGSPEFTLETEFPHQSGISPPRAGEMCSPLPSFPSLTGRP